MALFILIGIVLGVILVVVLLNKILHALSLGLGWLYWPITCLFAVLLYFMAKPGSSLCIFNAKDYEGFNACWGVFFLHFVHAYFLIPMMDGESSVYFTYSGDYNEATNTLTITEHKNDWYTPGWWRKLVVQAIIGFACFCVVWLLGFDSLRINIPRR